MESASIRIIRLNISTYLLASLMLLLASCGGNSASLAPATGIGDGQSSPTDRLPDQPGDLPTSGLSFPAPRLLLEQLAARRGAAQSDPSLRKEGYAFELLLPHERVEAAGGCAVFSPDWDPHGECDTSTTEIAFAMYTLTLDGYSLQPVLNSFWLSSSNTVGDMWVGLGNQQRNVWEWYDVTAEWSVITESLDPYIGGTSSEMLIAVVVLGSQQLALRELCLGGAIWGRVSDEYGDPLEGAYVRIAGTETGAETDSDGLFGFWGLQDSDHVVLQTSHYDPWTSYLPSNFVTDVVAGAVPLLDIMLFERADPVEVPTAGGMLTIPGGGSITLPADALVDSAGDPITWTVDGYFTLIDLADPDELAAAPGSFVTATGVVAPAGIIEIFLDDYAEGADLAEGKTAEVSLPIPPELLADAEDTVSLFSLDEESGLLVDDGTTLTKNGEFYEGELDSFCTHWWGLGFDGQMATLKVRMPDLPYIMDIQGPTLFQRNCAGVSASCTEQYHVVQDSYSTLERATLKVLPNKQYNLLAYAWLDVDKLATGVSGSRQIKIERTIQSPGPGEQMEVTLSYVEFLGTWINGVKKYGDPPADVTLHASVHSEGGTVVDYSWDWDGRANGIQWESVGASSSATHTYIEHGRFYPTVRVIDSNGTTAYRQYPIRVGSGGYGPGDWAPDTLYAVPSATQVHAGDEVTVTVYTGVPANPLQFMNGVRVTYEESNEYVTYTMDFGAPGWKTDPDGIWGYMNPSSFWSIPDWMLVETDIGGGRKALDMNVSPLQGTDLYCARGALFNFKLRVWSDVTLRFVEFDDLPRTYYSDGAANEYFWGNISNDHPGIANSITVIPE